MRQTDINRVAKELREKLDPLGRLAEIGEANAETPIWKEFFALLQPFFNDHNIAVYDRRKLFNAAIQEIREELHEKDIEKQVEQTNENLSEITPEKMNERYMQIGAHEAAAAYYPIKKAEYDEEEAARERARLRREYGMR